MKTYVLYHDNCNDGFGAAWAAWLVLGNDANYIPVQYNNPIPEIEDGSKVYIVDFSYPRTILTELTKKSEQVVVLDHHKTAKEELAELNENKLTIIFNMTKSGAILSWEYFHPDKNPPLFLKYIQDRDLWTWKLNNSREFSAGLTLEPKDFRAWSELSEFKLIKNGTIILKYQTQLVSDLAQKAYWTKIDEYEVPTVNSSLFQSELGEELCRLYSDAPFAAIYFFINDKEIIYSLRSRGTFDVSVVAKKFGGGGHPAAAGFKYVKSESRSRESSNQKS